MPRMKTQFTKPATPKITVPRSPSVRRPKTSVMKQNKPGKMAY
jgi:hypothetical protein